MYPSIELFGLTLYFQGVGIILSSLVFFYGLYRYSNKLKLKFASLFSIIPLLIMVPYFLGRYMYNLIEYRDILSFASFSIISPYNYRFAFIGISLGIFIVMFLFLLGLSYKEERKKYIDVFFFSITLALIVIGPFLLLGDIFYGTTTTSILGVNPFTENTQIPFIRKIWPVGIFVSILGLLLYLVGKIFYFFVKKAGITIYFLPMLFLGMAFIFHFQHYPKHFILGIDVKILYCYVMSFLSPLSLYLITKKNK